MGPNGCNIRGPTCTTQRNTRANTMCDIIMPLMCFCLFRPANCHKDQRCKLMRTKVESDSKKEKILAISKFRTKYKQTTTRLVCISWNKALERLGQFTFYNHSLTNTFLLSFVYESSSMIILNIFPKI